MPDDRVFQRDPVRAQDGPGLSGDLDRGPDVGHLAQADLLRRDLAVLLETAEVQRQEPRAGQVSQHPGKFGLCQLEAADRLAELLAGARILDRRLQTSPGGAGDSPHDSEPGLAQARQRPLQPGDPGQHRILGQLDLVEMQFRRDRGAQRHLLVDAPSGEATGPARHEKAADPVGGPGPHDGYVGDRPVRDPHLGSRQYPALIVWLREGFHASGIGTVIRFGEAEASDRVPGRHPGQPFLLLRVRAVPPDRVHGERALHRDQAAQPGVGRLQLATGDAIGDRAHARAAVTGQLHAEQAQLAEFRHQFARERAGLEPVCDVGHDAVGRVAAHRVADQALVGRQLVVEL